MKSKLFNVSRVISLAGAVLLMALGLVLFAASGAFASKNAIITQFNCNVSCDSAQTTCNRGCCGPLGLICGGNCISNCQSSADACKAGCASGAIGATSSESAFDDTATIAPNGRIITISGPLSCSEGGKADLQVTITQNNGAIAEGNTRILCPDTDERTEYSFTLNARTIGGVNFQAPGIAKACGVARIGAANLTLDALQWCREITILPEGVELED